MFSRGGGVAVEAHLHAILKLGYYGAMADELKQLALPVEGQRDDEGHKDRHLEHEESEDLRWSVMLVHVFSRKWPLEDGDAVRGRRLSSCLRRGGCC